MLKGSQPDFRSPISAKSSEATAFNFPVIFIQNLIGNSIDNAQMMQELYVVQQNLKFGPSEQLILRSTLLSGQRRQKLQAIITQRNLIVENLLESSAINGDLTGLEAKLNTLNQELDMLEYPEIPWPEIYPKLGTLKKNFGPESLYIDFRHDKAGNSIGLFSVTNSEASFDIIQNADQIAAISEDFLTKLKSGDETFFEEGQLLYKKILEPYLTPQTNKILISPHSFLYDVPFSALVISNDGSSFTSLSSGGVTRGLNFKNKASSQIGKNTYLGERYELSLVSTVVKSDRSFLNSEYTYFGIGNPNFSGTKPDAVLAFNIFQNEPSRSGASISSLPALPETEEELKLFAKPATIYKLKGFN